MTPNGDNLFLERGVGGMDFSQHHIRSFEQEPLSLTLWCGFPTGIGRMSDLVLDRGLGAEVWTVDGNRYLDMTCGIGVTNTGHCHPKVLKEELISL